MTRKFKIGDKVRLNPNMDYSCINLSCYNKYKRGEERERDDEFIGKKVITGLTFWRGKNKFPSGLLVKEMYCYSLDSRYTFPESYLIKVKD